MTIEGFNAHARSPIFEARQADRYARQELIRQYEELAKCRLVVMISPIVTESVTLFEELIYDADPSEDLHLLLDSPGGDGEVAIRIVRAAQSRCKELTVIVPDQAKSAATLLSLGAHHIVMGPASDLGPIDPQFFIQGEWVAAKDIISAVGDASEKVMASPDTYPIHAALLSDITAIMVQQAHAALDRTAQQLNEALMSNPDREANNVEELNIALSDRMIQGNPTHGALFSADDALGQGLPVIKANPSNRRWQLIWRLWARYFALGVKRNRWVYESARASQVDPFN